MEATLKAYPTKAKVLLGTLTTGHMINDFYALVLPFLLPTLIGVFQLDYFRAGLLGFATSLFPGVLQPVLGFVADRYSARKRVMLFGFSAFAIGLFIVGSSASYAVLLIGFLIFGIGQGTFHAQSTTFISHTFKAAKGRAMGIHGMGGSVGNFTVPIVVTLLLGWSTWRNTVFFLAVPALLVIVILSLLLVELGGGAVDSNRFTFRLDRPLIMLGLGIGLMALMYRSVLIFLPTYLLETGISEIRVGSITTVMLFVGFLAQPLGGYAYDKVGGRTLYAVCALLAGAFLLIFTLYAGLIQILFIVLFGAAVLALFPVSLAMGGDLAKGEMVGLKVGTVFGLSGLMSALGQPLAGYLADQFGLLTAIRLQAIFALVMFLVALQFPGMREAKSS